MSRTKVVVDPSFPSMLRQLRRERGLSYRTLGSVSAYSHTLLWEVETGRKQPTRELARRIDQVLCTGGVLSRLLTVEAAHGEDEARLAYAARHPRRVDARTLEVLSTLLAEQRYQEDEIGAGPLIVPVTQQLAVITELVREAPGRQRPTVITVAAQWAQFAGWLNTSAGRPGIAEAWFDRAIGWAVEAGNPDLTATVLSFKGHLAWLDGRIGAMIGLTEAAQRIDGVYPGEMAYDALQAGRGHAVAGGRAEVESAVARSVDLEAEAREYTDPIPPWHYYRDQAFFAVERGRVFRHLTAVDGYARRAVEELTAGLAGLPKTAAYGATYLYDLGVAQLLEGDLAAACNVLDELGRIASTQGSERVAALVRRLRRQTG